MGVIGRETQKIFLSLLCGKIKMSKFARVLYEYGKQ